MLIFQGVPSLEGSFVSYHTSLPSPLQSCCDGRCLLLRPLGPSNGWPYYVGGGEGGRLTSHKKYIYTPPKKKHMGVSENSGFSSKSSILIGFSIIFTIHFGGNTPIFGFPPICERCQFAILKSNRFFSDKTGLWSIHHLGPVVRFLSSMGLVRIFTYMKTIKQKNIPPFMWVNIRYMDGMGIEFFLLHFSVYQL